MAIDPDAAMRVTWAIASTSAHLEELNGFWGRALQISGPQWMILIALAERDPDSGICVNAVAKKLQVGLAIVTTQSKVLEKKGLLERRTSELDARVVRCLSQTGSTSAWGSSLPGRER